MNQKPNLDRVLLGAIFVLGLILMFVVGILAITFPPQWSIKASMDSSLDPDLEYARSNSGIQIMEPISPSILTPQPWQNAYLTPSHLSDPISVAYDGVKNSILRDSAFGNLYSKVKINASDAPANLPFEPLTPREKDILIHVVSGRSNKQIAKKLRISPKTVEVYLYRITRKLRVPTRVGVAVIAVKLGLVDVEYADLQVDEFEDL